MVKKGQISLFIILGIIILAIVIFFFYQRGQTQETIKPETAITPALDVSPVQMFVQQCLERTIEEELITLGSQGGYLSLPFNSVYIKEKNYSTTYSFYNYTKMIISPEQMSAQLEEEIKLLMQDCVGNFSMFSGYSITGDLKSVNVSYFDDRTVFEIFYPLKIAKDSKISELNKFVVNSPVRLSYYVKIMHDIVDRAIYLRPVWIDGGYLASLDLNASAMSYSNDTIVYVLKDEKNKYKDLNFYLFVFAVKVEEPFIASTTRIAGVWHNGTIYADLSG